MRRSPTLAGVLCSAILLPLAISGCARNLVAPRGEAVRVDYVIARRAPGPNSPQWAVLALDSSVDVSPFSTIWIRTRPTASATTPARLMLHGPIIIGEQPFALEVVDNGTVVLFDTLPSPNVVAAAYPSGEKALNASSAAAAKCCSCCRGVVRRFNKAVKDVAHEAGKVVHNGGVAIGKAGEDTWREGGVAGHNVGVVVGKGAKDTWEEIRRAFRSYDTTATAGPDLPDPGISYNSISVVFATDAFSGRCTRTPLYYVVDGKVYAADGITRQRTDRVISHIVNGVVYAADAYTGARTDKVLRYIDNGVVYAADAFTGARTSTPLVYIVGQRVYASDAITHARTDRVLRCIEGTEVTD